MQDPVEASSGVVALLGFVALASAAAWMAILRRWSAGRPMVDREPRQPVPWSLLDALLIFMMWIMLPVVCMGLVKFMLPGLTQGAKSTGDLQAVMLATLLGNLLSVVLGTLWLSLPNGTARGSDLGVSLGKLPGDLWLGAVAFAAVAVPVYIIQAALVHFIPSEHPLVELLRLRQDVPTAVLAVLTAAIAAPLGEEFLFRLVLQGALEKTESRIIADAARDRLSAGDIPAADLGSAAVPIPGMPAADTPTVPVEQTVPPEASAELSGPAQLNPYASPQSASSQLLPTTPEAVAESYADQSYTPDVRIWGLPPGIWPILIPASLFALMHFQHGPDPIPLFVLAVALGYLYRQTHRIVPSVIVHFLLNSCSLATLWLQRM